jgi:RHS repeat-associated protein
MLREMLKTFILKAPTLHPSIFLRTLAGVVLFMLLSPVENVQALVECKERTPYYCNEGETCIFYDDGVFGGCCRGTLCGDSDATRACCEFPTPNCGPLPATCVAKPPKLPDDPCKEPGCIIGAETRTLGEVIPLTGSPFGLTYQSNLASQRHALGLGGWSLSVLHSYDSPSRILYLGNGDQRSIPAANGSLPPGASILGVSIPAEDGSELYVFSGTGRHQRTLDALTGSVRYQFTYDSAGRLATVTDGDNNVTTIERDGSGNPSAVIAPFGQRTTLAVDTDGYLSRIENPAGETVQMTYNVGNVKGLLATLTRPIGQHRYTIDPLAGLVRDEAPSGGATYLVRSDIADNHSSVKVTRASGQETTYEVEELPTGETVRRIDRSGVRTESVIRPDGSRRQTYADGSVMNLVKGPDPRFGMQAPINKSLSLTTPGGLARTTTMERTANLADPANILSLNSQTTTVGINGHIYTRAYDGASHTFKDTTPGGRQRITTIDAKGRAIQSAVAGTSPVQLAYDERGRLASRTQGDRTYTLSYDNQGYLSKLTDPLAHDIRFSYDTTGRVTRQTLPDGRQIRYGYDSNGNMTSLTPPRRPSHIFAYTTGDQMYEYQPPLSTDGGNTKYSHDYDKKITYIIRPDGRLISFNYDHAGRLTSQTTPTGATNYAYNATTGQVNYITAPDGGKLNFAYDGPLLTGVASSGTIAGDVVFSYNNDFRLSSLTVNGSDPVSFSYDADSFLTQAGALLLTRDVQKGLVIGTALGVVNDSFSYNGFGELLSYTAQINAASVFSTQFTRDKLGRIIQKIETLGGGRPNIYDYSYDVAGRLIQVRRNGSVSASYTYDSNGNRLTASGVSKTTYDNQDRLLSYNGSTYTYTANGELKSRTKGGSLTSYDYDLLGNLRQVTLPGRTTIDYVIDGQNRRIGKKVGGVVKQGFLYQDQLKPVAELDGINKIVSRFVYGTKVNVPEYMVKGGITYRIVTDHLGSPRLVINATDGTIVQRMEYDEFGQVTADTAPGFQPFGFAGGLYDPDTKLVRFGARDYDAETGRWTAKDLLMFAGGDTNLYRYVANDPINFIDPKGQECVNVTGPNDYKIGGCGWCLVGSVGYLSGSPVGKAAAFFSFVGQFQTQLPPCSACFDPIQPWTRAWPVCSPSNSCGDVCSPSNSCDDYWPGDPETPSPCNPAPVCESPPREPIFTPAGPNFSGG